MPKMKALGNINHDGELTLAGKTFTVDDNDSVRELMAAGSAELVIEQPTPPKEEPPTPPNHPNQTPQGQGERGK